MLAIRLNRTGKRNRAHFRVAVQEHTKAPGKRHIEIVGSYDPHKKTTLLNKERIMYWISKGAQVSDAVHNMLVREGVIEGKKVAKKMPRPVVKEAPVEEAAAAPSTETETAAVVEEAPAESSVSEPVSDAVAPEVVPEKVEAMPAEEKKEENPVEEPKA